MTKGLIGQAIALLAFVACSQVQAQTYEQQTASGTAPNAGSSATLRSYNSGTVGLKGSPMLLQGWVPGELTLQSGNKITAGLFNYDVFNRQVAVKTSPRDSVRYESSGIKQLTLFPAADAQPLRYEHLSNLITDVAALKSDLVRIIYQGPYSLVELPVRSFIKASAKQAYGGMGEVSNEYRDESVYYLIRPDHTTERVKLNRKSLVRALKEKGDLFDGYLKNNGIDVKNEADAAKALAYLGQQ